MNISNEYDVVAAYNLIRCLQAGTPEPGKEDQWKQCIIELKKEVRAFNQVQCAKVEERRIIREYGIDGYIELIQLPTWVQTMECAKKYFESHEAIGCIPSACGCTGRSYTGWYKIIMRCGRMWAYHRVMFDV